MTLDSVTIERPDLAGLTIAQMAERYNASAELLGKPVVKKFSDRPTGIKRLEVLFQEIEALAPKIVQEAKVVTKVVKEAKVAKEEGRRKRQKVFCYPPLESLKAIVPNSLRAQGRDMLVKGATLRQIEDLIFDFDRARGKPTTRAPERAYGLVRLLHTYVGYALREEGEDEEKTIFVMTREQWLAWKAL